MTGTCKWWDNVKGFGFITIDGQERDVRTVSQKSHPRGLPMPASLQPLPGSRVTSQRRGAACVLLSGTSSHRSAVPDRCSSTIATSTPLASAAWPRESPWSSSWGRSKRPARWRRPLHTRPEVLAPHDRCAPLPSARPQHSRSPGPTAPLYKVARRRGPTHGIEAATTSTDHHPHANAGHARSELRVRRELLSPNRTAQAFPYTSTFIRLSFQTVGYSSAAVQPTHAPRCVRGTSGTTRPPGFQSRLVA